jgi:hypothetical protein
MDRAQAEEWIREHVEPAGAIEVEKERSWATTLRVPTRDGAVFFKAAKEVQAFEPRLTVELASRWPGRVAEVIASDLERNWLLMHDAGVPLMAYGNQPEAWHAVLPAYAELQRGETEHAADHLAHGVPDRRLEALPEQYERLLDFPLPLDPGEVAKMRALAPRFAALCEELASLGVAQTIQHDDLHMANVFDDGERLRVLDWGDSCISHPFCSLVVTFQFLREVTKLPADDPWFPRLRSAYLEPWGGDGLDDVVELALRVGAVAYAIAWARQWEYLPEDERAEFAENWAFNLRGGVALIAG